MKKTLFIYTLLMSICLSFSPVQAVMVYSSGYQVEIYATYEYPGLSTSLFGMTFDDQGNLYVPYRSGHIVKIYPDGTSEIFASGVGDICDIAWTGGSEFGNNLYVTDMDGDRVKKIDMNGNVSYFASLNPDPVTIAFDSVGNFGGLLFAGTNGQDRIESFLPNGQHDTFSPFPYDNAGGVDGLAFDLSGKYGWKMYVGVVSLIETSYRGVYAIDTNGQVTKFSKNLAWANELESDPGEWFDGALFARGSKELSATQYLWKLDVDGNASLFSNSSIGSFCFGPDGAMYVSEYNSDGRTVTISRIIPGTPVGLEVVGLDEVSEGFEWDYKAIAHYDNNSTRVVTDFVEWSVEPNINCSITGGVLTTGSIDFPEDVTITARYIEGENVQEAYKDVSIFTVCPGGYALDFNGSSDYVDLGQTPELKVPLPLTVMAWVNVTEEGLTKNNHLLRIGGGGLGFKISPLGNDIFFGSASGSRRKRGNTFLEASRWYHIAGVIRGPDDMDIYVNAVDDGGSYSGTGEGPVVYGDDISTIGSNAGGQFGFFNGMMDDMRLYDEALSQEEVEIAMFGGDTAAEPIGHWKFDEGDGQDVADSSANGHDGTLGSTSGDDDNDPEWVEGSTPVGICSNVGVDIRPGGCPNPLNVASRGVLPVAVLGSAEFDVGSIDPGSIFLDGVPAIRTDYKDVAGAVPGSDGCECGAEGGDGYIDLTLKFRTQDIVEKLLAREGELAKGQSLVLSLSGQLQDDGSISGYDCVVLVGNVPRHLMARSSDINGDGAINVLDLAKLSEYWLESVNVQ